MAIEDAQFVEGGDVAREKLTNFFRKFVGPDLEQGFKVVLTHHTKTSEDELADFQFELGDDVAELVDEIVDAADTEAKDMRFRGTIRLSARITGIGKLARCTFSLKGHVPRMTDSELEEKDIEEYDEEMPNARGLVAQTQKHLEAMTKLTLGTVERGQSRLERENDKLRSELAAERKRTAENMRLYEELQQMQFARGLEIKKFEAEEERNDKMMEMGAAMIPPLLNRFMGGGAAAAQASEGVRQPIEQMLDGFLSSLEENQLQAIGSVLKPDQMLIVYEMKNYVDQRRQAEEAMRAQQAAQQGQQPSSPHPPPPPASPNPAANGSYHPFANHPFAPQ